MFRKGRLIGFLLTALFLWIVARNVSLAELVTAFQSADYRLVLPAALATFCGYLLRTVRWQYIVRPVAPLAFGPAFAVLMMGFTANNLLPARLGEFVRAYMLRRKTGARKTYGMATIILERVCDGVTLIVLLGMVSLLMPLPAWGQEVQIISSVLFLGAAAGMIAVLAKESLAMAVVALAFRPLPARVSGGLLHAATAFIAGLHSLKSRSTLLGVVSLSVVVWLLEASSYLLITRAFGVGLQPSTQVLAAVFLLVVVNLGIMLPSAPGYIGTFQFFAVMALGVFGIPKETALAVAISSHLMQYVMVTAVGIVFFLRENLGLWSLGEKAEQEAAAEDDATGELPPERAATETVTTMAAEARAAVLDRDVRVTTHKPTEG